MELSLPRPNGTGARPSDVSQRWIGGGGRIQDFSLGVLDVLTVFRLQKSHGDRGSCDQKQLQKSLRTCFRVRGGSEIQKTLCSTGIFTVCRKIHFFFQHLGRLSQLRLTGNSLSTRGVFQPLVPGLARKK